jgi:hypothetical protein
MAASRGRVLLLLKSHLRVTVWSWGAATAKLQAKKSKTEVRSETEAQVERLTAHLRATVGTFGDWRFERGDPYPPPPPPGALIVHVCACD